MSSGMIGSSLMEEIAHQRLSRDLIAVHTSETENILAPSDNIESKHHRQAPIPSDNFKVPSSLSREESMPFSDLKVMRKTLGKNIRG